MAIGFPARAEGTRWYDVGPNALKGAVAKALDELGWGAYGNRSGSRFEANAGVSFWSWGESIRVEIDRDGTVWVESRCKLPTQCFDWGKNRRNVASLLDLVEEMAECDDEDEDRPARRTEYRPGPDGGYFG